MWLASCSHGWCWWVRFPGSLFDDSMINTIRFIWLMFVGSYISTIDFFFRVSSQALPYTTWWIDHMWTASIDMIVYSTYLKYHLYGWRALTNVFHELKLIVIRCNCTNKSINTITNRTPMCFYKIKCHRFLQSVNPVIWDSLRLTTRLHNSECIRIKLFLLFWLFSATFAWKWLVRIDFINKNMMHESPKKMCNKIINTWLATERSNTFYE